MFLVTMAGERRPVGIVLTVGIAVVGVLDVDDLARCCARPLAADAVAG
jgi:hypothetical protein